MAFVIVYSLATGQLTGDELVFGFGLALVGLVLSFVSKASATRSSTPTRARASATRSRRLRQPRAAERGLRPVSGGSGARSGRWQSRRRAELSCDRRRPLRRARPRHLEPERRWRWARAARSPPAPTPATRPRAPKPAPPSSRRPTGGRRSRRSWASCAAGGAPPERWAAVGLSGMIPTLVVADDDGAPVAPAITWEDGRAEPEGEALRGAPRRRAPVCAHRPVGRRPLPAAHVPAPGARAPRAARRARRLLGAKDWLFLRLTGEFAAPTRAPASGFGCYGLQAGAWLDDVVAAAGDELRAVAHAVAPTHAPPGDGSAPPGEPPPASAPLALPGLPAVLPSTATRPVRPAAAARLGLPEGLPVCRGRGRLGAGLPGDGRRARRRRRLRRRHEHRATWASPTAS